MTIELTILISVISVCATIYGVARNMRRDVKTDAVESTTVLIKLENIQTDVKDMKGDVKGMRQELKEVDKRLTKVEESAKQAHKRIDEWHHPARME